MSPSISVTSLRLKGSQTKTSKRHCQKKSNDKENDASCGNNNAEWPVAW